MRKNQNQAQAWDYGACLGALEAETGLVRRIGEAQERVRGAVMERTWAGFTREQRELERLGGEFAGLEAKRLRYFSLLAGGEELPFYALAARLPPEERRGLTEAYRTLKLETLKIRAAGESFAGYLGEAKTLISAFLEAAFPVRGGKLYSRKGLRVPQDIRSMVVNRRV
jgi:hypothetical protein